MVQNLNPKRDGRRRLSNSRPRREEFSKIVQGQRSHLSNTSFFILDTNFMLSATTQLHFNNITIIWWGLGCHWIFQWHIPSDRFMALGSTQPLVKMSTRKLSWGVNAAGAWGWQRHHLHVQNVMESKPPGTLWATSGLLRDTFIFTFYHYLVQMPDFLSYTYIWVVC